MASTGVASAPSRIVVGPLVTQGGFQYWYLACFPDCVVAVQQGIGAFFALGLSNSMGSAFGLLGGLVQVALRPRAQAFRQRIEFALRNTPTTRLRMKPNVVYQTSELMAITYKQKKGAPLILSDLTLELANGVKKRFGVAPVDIEKSLAQIKQMYPTLTNTL